MLPGRSQPDARILDVTPHQVIEPAVGGVHTLRGSLAGTAHRTVPVGLPGVCGWVRPIRVMSDGFEPDGTV